jgi:sugar lactone lactonase YvrE
LKKGHGGHGRLLVYDPATGNTKMLLDGLNFANGVAVSHDQRAVLVDETGSYRVIRFWLAGPQKGEMAPTPSIPASLKPRITSTSAAWSHRFWED